MNRFTVKYIFLICLFNIVDIYIFGRWSTAGEAGRESRTGLPFSLLNPRGFLLVPPPPPPSLSNT
jgi:hypothetical protein